MRVYVVVSFDFGGSSDVKVHVATTRLELAQGVYDSVCPPDSEGPKRLVELVHVPADTPLLGRDALTLFWGSGVHHNNNRCE